MIELAWETPIHWAQRALERPLELLSDHAHCELRAAASAQAMIVKNPGQTGMVQRLGAIAIEELEHFRQVMRLLEELGGALRPALPNPYMAELLGRSAQTRSHGLLDRLLIAGLIERRSLERFELLGQAAAQAGIERVAALYEDLGPSERGHALTFVDLAREAYPEADVEGRLGALRALEGEIMSALGFEARIHSGCPAILSKCPS